MAGKLRSLGEQFHTSLMEFKSVEEDGTFTGYASVFSKDSDGDIIVKGAFTRTIKNKGGRVPILWQHNKSMPIGLNMEMKEDDYGLLVKGQLNQDTQLGKEARSLIKQGAINGLSIGFYITQPPEVKDGVRYIKEVNLVEYSVVTFPANEDAQVGNMKGGHPVASKAGETDFDAVLAQQQAERDLWDERWECQSALSETINNIIGDGDETVAKDAAVAAIKKTYVAYSEKMVDWWGRYIDAMLPTADAKSANTPEEKAAASMASKIRKYKDAHSSAMNASQNSQNLHRKAIDMVDQLVYAHLIQGDRNAPNPQPKGNPSQPLSQTEHLPNQKDTADFMASLDSLVFKR